MSKPATVLRINGRAFTTQLYSASEALDILVTVGEVLAEPLGRLLGREVDREPGALSEAFGELQDLGAKLDGAAFLSLFQAVRKVGGTDLVVRLLSTTFHADRPINSRERFDDVFTGAAGLVDAALLLKEVVKFQSAPLLDALAALRAAGEAGA